MSLNHKKNVLRDSIWQTLKVMPTRRRREKSDRISKKLIAERVFQKANSILIYMSLPSEVQTKKIIEFALGEQKKVYLPKVIRGSKQLGLYEVRDLKKDLVKGAYGIREPRALKSRKTTLRRLDLIIAPGLGFTKKGKRLGRGGGYYDRLLAKAKGIKKIGLCFREQILTSIPSEKHDQKVNKVLYS